MEDDPAICRLLEALLDSAGHHVLTASDGPTALTLVTEQRPAVVLLDLTLPALSGWEVLRRVQGMAGAPPVIVLSADVPSIPRALQAGAVAGIVKPFDIDELLDMVERVLR